MNFLDAAEKALRAIGESLHSTQIIALAVRKGWIRPKGRMPDHSLQSALWADINGKGSRSRFKVVGSVPVRKKYTLRKP
jgi:hypothetical protein